MLDSAVFAERRARLAEQIGDGLILLPGNELSPMNYAENHYGFRQDGSFRYYFGLNMPGLAGTLDANTGEATLFGHEATIEDVSGYVGSFVTTVQSEGQTKTIRHGAVILATGADEHQPTE